MTYLNQLMRSQRLTKAELSRQSGIPETTLRLRDICAQKGIEVWVDVWGYDCAHDWDWWYKQVAYFVPFLLD